MRVASKDRQASKSKASSASHPGKRPAKPPRPEIPAILLEGDRPPQPVVSGPGKRYALGPTPFLSPPSSSEPVELPESYGTGELILAARDPHWLYAHWDFTREEIRAFNSRSTDGHLILRIYRGEDLISEIHVHPESRNWFVPVPQGGARYQAELGYHDRAQEWVSLSRSLATLTPPEGLSADVSVTFATIPPDVPFAQLLATVKTTLRKHAHLATALQETPTKELTGLPAPRQIKAEWTPGQEEALARLVSMDDMRRVWIGSVEVTELVRRQLEVSSRGAAQLRGRPPAEAEQIGAAGAEAQAGVTSPSQPFGKAPGEKGFWFSINAEVIVYGATESDAKVMLGDRPIRLRPDGSFSFRFALPDGEFSLPATAQSADGEEVRKARLKFTRATVCEGEVGRHPQQDGLEVLSPEAVS